MGYSNKKNRRYDSLETDNSKLRAFQKMQEKHNRHANMIAAIDTIANLPAGEYTLAELKQWHNQQAKAHEAFAANTDHTALLDLTD